MCAMMNGCCCNPSWEYRVQSIFCVLLSAALYEMRDETWKGLREFIYYLKSKTEKVKPCMTNSMSISLSWKYVHYQTYHCSVKNK